MADDPAGAGDDGDDHTEAVAASRPAPAPAPTPQGAIDIGEPTRPRVTLAFLAAVVVATSTELMYAGLTPATDELARFGGASIGAVATGATWKLVTANLLHGGVAHVALNVFVILLTGRALEHLVGRTVTAAVIAWSMLLASVGALVTGGAAVTVGASGVAFGLVGAAVAVDPRAHTIVGTVGRSLLVVNLIGTFVIPGISIGGHIGGLVAGLAVGALAWRGRRGPTTERAGNAGRPRPVLARTMLATGVVVLAALAASPLVGGAADEQWRRSVVGPRLELQLEGDLVRDGDVVSGSDASCRARGRGAATWTCDLDLDGERQSGVEVTYRRRDDQWRASFGSGAS